MAGPLVLRAYMLTSASAPWCWSSSAGSSNLSCTGAPPAASRLPLCAFSRLPDFAPDRRCMPGSAARCTLIGAQLVRCVEVVRGRARVSTARNHRLHMHVHGRGCVSVRGRKLRGLAAARQAQHRRGHALERSAWHVGVPRPRHQYARVGARSPCSAYAQAQLTACAADRGTAGTACIRGPCVCDLQGLALRPNAGRMLPKERLVRKPLARVQTRRREQGWAECIHTPKWYGRCAQTRAQTSAIGAVLAAMAQAAFGRAMMASGATLLVLGGGTVAISGITMTVTKAVVDKARVSMAACRPWLWLHGPLPCMVAPVGMGLQNPLLALLVQAEARAHYMRLLLWAQDDTVQRV